MAGVEVGRRQDTRSDVSAASRPRPLGLGSAAAGWRKCWAAIRGAVGGGTGSVARPVAVVARADRAQQASAEAWRAPTHKHREDAEAS